MAKLRVHNFAISVDGYGAGPSQSIENPLGVGGPPLHEWVFATRYGRRMIGEEGGEEGLVPIFLLGGERLFDGLDGGPGSYRNVEMVGSALGDARPIRAPVTASRRASIRAARRCPDMRTETPTLASQSAASAALSLSLDAARGGSPVRADR